MKANFNRDNTKYGKRHTPGVMNATETRYAAGLQQLKETGEIIDWQFEAVTLKLAKDCRYTPDFLILHNNGEIEFVDAKGGGPMDEKSRVKVKCAADKFFCFRFVIAKAKPKKAGGGFAIEEF